MIERWLSIENIFDISPTLGMVALAIDCRTEVAAFLRRPLKEVAMFYHRPVEEKMKILVYAGFMWFIYVFLISMTLVSVKLLLGGSVGL